MTQRLAKKILRASGRYSLAQYDAADRLWNRNLKRYCIGGMPRARWGKWDPNLVFSDG